MRRLPVVAFAVLGALVAVSGCSLPDDDRPRLVTDDNALADLTPEAPPATDAPGGESVTLAFIDPETGRLEDVRRTVEDRSAEMAVTVLLQGLTEDDPEGLQTAIPDGTLLLELRTDGNTATVDLTSESGEGGGILSVVGTTLLQATGQIVRTVTALPGIELVLFAVDGVPTPVLTDAGPTAEPVDRADYASLAPTIG